jgi:uncharacterized membrane protein SpoIIM required for sporulation
VNVSDALRTAVGAVLYAPSAVLPFYLVAAAVATVGRVPVLVALAAAVVHLADAGRIDPLVSALREIEPGSVDPGGPAAPPTLPPALESAVAGLVTPTTVGLLLAGVAAAVVVTVLARSVAAAGTLHAVYAAFHPANAPGLDARWDDPGPTGDERVETDGGTPPDEEDGATGGSDDEPDGDGEADDDEVLETDPSFWDVETDPPVDGSGPGAGPARADDADAATPAGREPGGGAEDVVEDRDGGATATGEAAPAAGEPPDPAVAGVAGVAADWRTFLGVRLLRIAAAVAVVGVAAGVALPLSGVGTVGPPLAGLVVAGGLVLAAGVQLLFAFAGQAVVVDGVGATAAVRRSAGYPLRRPGAFLAYLVSLGFLAGVVLVLALVAGAAGAARTVGLVTALVAPPLLDGFKTALYADDLRTDLPDPPAVRAGSRAGLASLGGFLREAPLASLAALATFLGGGAVGYAAVARYETTLPITGEGVAALGFSVGTFLNIAANNWLVAAGAGYGGLALGVPTLVALAFNGVLVGAVGAVVEPVAFLALVAPHGVIEVPALAVSGGLGLHLGRVGLRALRGRSDAEAVADELVRAWRVLVGLAFVFVLAAFVEAFLTPFVAGRVLG